MIPKPSTPANEQRASAIAESRRSRLQRAVDRIGKERVLQATGLAEGTLWRALARGPLYRSTCLAIDAGLDLLEREAP
jgi:hypothetical protein